MYTEKTCSFTVKMSGAGSVVSEVSFDEVSFIREINISTEIYMLTLDKL